MASLYGQNRKSILYLAVLIGIIILMNLVSLNILPLGQELFYMLLLILIIWVSIGVAIILRWFRLTFRKIG